MIIAALAALAIVTQDKVVLRAAPARDAAQHALLWQGEVLEVRGQRLDYLQVYDHRLERAGYVRAGLARPLALEESEAPELLAVTRFLADTPGQEALGIAYAAAYLKAAPARAITAEPFDALGRMAERLATRSTGGSAAASDLQQNAHLDAATSVGLRFNSYERGGRIQICYDGDAYRHVLAMPATAEQHARAVLALTRGDCIDPKLGPVELHGLNQGRAELLDGVELASLPEDLKNRLRIRRAAVWSELAFEASRRGEPTQEAGTRALDALAGVTKTQLTEDDRKAYTEAALRVGASRWSSEPVPAAGKGLAVVTAPGEPGQTCILLTDPKHRAEHALFRRCTYGTVWPASAQVSRGGEAVALAVQPLAGWRELWLFARKGADWSLKILPPAASDPDLGYAEFAGWVPGQRKLLVAREARVQDRWLRSFEVVRLDTLAVERHASEPSRLSAFDRWPSAAWKTLTVALR